MAIKIFPIDEQEAVKVRSYLCKRSNQEQNGASYMGHGEEAHFSDPSFSNEFWYFEGLGLNISKDQETYSLVFHGKTERKINRKHSKLIELSNDFE